MVTGGLPPNFPELCKYLEGYETEDYKLRSVEVYDLESDERLDFHR